MSEKNVFDEAKRDLEKKASKPYENPLKLNKKYVLLFDAKAVLGDLHHRWCESQKTLKELFDERPYKNMIASGNNPIIETFNEWFEKAEKLLDAKK